MKLTIHVFAENDQLLFSWQINSSHTQRIITDDIVAFADALTAKVLQYKWPDNTPKELPDETDPTSD